MTIIPTTMNNQSTVPSHRRNGPGALWLPLVSAVAGQVVSMLKAATPQSAAWSGAEAWLYPEGPRVKLSGSCLITGFLTFMGIVC